jgi:hypothetical protein
MITEPIKRYCCVCGRKLPSNKSVRELIEMGSASKFGDAQLIFHCLVRHTPEQIKTAANSSPPFRTAMLPKKGETHE